jgi:thiol-disulfide isomerase/thioredoxin
MSLFKKRPKPIALESTDHLMQLVDDGKPVFVDFYQYGCSPCQVMDGIINELAEEFEGSAVVVKANAAHVPDAFDRFKVKSTPTFLILTRSPGANALTQRWRASGMVRKDVLTKSLISAGAEPVDR